MICKKIFFALIGTMQLALMPLCAQTNAPSDLMLLDVLPATNVCYVGEAIALNVNWSVYPPVGQFKAVDIQLPTMQSDLFKVYDSHKQVDQPNSKSLGVPLSGTRAIANLRSQKFGSNEYTTLSMKKILVPAEPGTHALTPSTIRCAMTKNVRAQPQARNRAKGVGNLYQYPIYFDNAFFDMDISSNDAPMTAISAETSIEVLPLPGERPTLFNGLVGQYNLAVSLSTNSVRKGDPIVLNMAVASTGYIAHVKLADLALQPGLTNSFRTVSDRRMRSINGDRILFSQTIYPLIAGKQSLPSLSLSYFNPETKQYETSVSEPIAISVEEAKVIDGSIFGSDTDTTVKESHPIRWVLALLSIVVLSLIIYTRYARFRKPEQDDSIDMSEAYRQFRNTVKLLRKTDYSNARDQHQALNSAVSNLLAAHLTEHKPGAITYSDVEELLIARGASDELRDKSRTLFKEMDMCRFSPAAPTMSYETAISQALELINMLHV